MMPGKTEIDQYQTSDKASFIIQPILNLEQERLMDIKQS